ncbi:Wzz/FepE/Etk N-terminal domain-containing protein [Anaerotalea alkaliphila]|uniref:Polysaccharide chain length determinant N-terminal domain-containing protein n=1 Tax=Anaerotalea alkaliphila TaxID=2662126 RepID=A0A7X5KL75_9FIRM|nr:Wzz/FepE/Etk N-terminal domain-containing protein [Anaerotalea alkaliphila]NDL66409.1 hypothetical protein [Anaerotalea alkaliphila]
MSEPVQQHEHEYDEISIKELILAVWGQRKVVVAVAALVFALAAVYAFAFNSPSYESSTGLIMKAPKEIVTRYGSYTFPSENIGDYTNYIYSTDVARRLIGKHQLGMTEEQFNRMVQVDLVKDSNQFAIKVSHEDPETAYTLNKDLVDAFIQNLRIAFKTNAVRTFSSEMETETARLENEIRVQEKILVGLTEVLESVEPVYTLQRLLVSDPVTAAQVANRFNLDLASLSDDRMVEEFANENYFLVQAQALEVQTALVKLREEQANKQLLKQELVEEQQLLTELLDTPKEGEILNGKLDVLANNLLITSPPILPQSPVGTGKMLILAIGAVLGAMMGLFVGFFLHYWKNS